MAMEAQDVSSSAFSQILHDSDTGQTVVIFQDGSRFTYVLPEEVMQSWLGASSIGGFYNTNIRGQFAFFAS